MKGLRPEMPKHINEEIKTLIQECWQLEPSKRPTFQQILSFLNDIKI